MRVLERKRRFGVLCFAMMIAVLMTFSSVAPADTFRGTDGDDRLVGTDGNDYIDSGRGNDNLEGRRGADRMIGGFGNDYVNGGFGNDNLDGGAGADRVYGGAGNDPVVSGGSGNDPLVSGGSGDDYVSGYTGDDKVYGYTGDDEIVGGRGNDEIYGSDGNDFIPARDLQRDVIDCGAGGRDRVQADPSDEVASNCEKVLTISADGGFKLAGSFESGGTTVSFNGNVVDNGGTDAGVRPYSKEVSSEVRVGDVTLNTRVNPENNTFTLSSSDTVLNADQKQAILLGGQELVKYLEQSTSEADEHKSLLVRSLAYYSETPAGYKYPASTQKPLPEQNGGDSSAIISDDDEYTSSRSGDYGTFATPGAGDDDGVTIIEGNSPQTSTHDAEDHPLRDNDTSTANDLGRCGKAESGPFLQSAEYTQDCLDHDDCVGLHQAGIGPVDNDCGDEFFEASEDFIVVNFPFRPFTPLSAETSTDETFQEEPRDAPGT